jgi:HAD superfamily hydrolase (TIGR01662 family)
MYRSEAINLGAIAMQPITTILFDLGNTLLYSQADWEQVMPEAVAVLFEHLPGLDQNPVSAPLQDSFLRRLYDYMAERELDLLETSTSELLHRFLVSAGYPAQDPDSLQSGVDAMYTYTQRFWHLEADAIPTLQHLHQLGYRMAVISNAMDDRNTQDLVDKGRLRGFFEIILSSASAGVRKPDVRIFSTVLERMRVAPHQAVMVGDTLNADILGAQRAGIHDIWLTRRADTPGNRSDIAFIQPASTIGTLAELPDFLRLRFGPSQ